MGRKNATSIHVPSNADQELTRTISDINEHITRLSQAVGVDVLDAKQQTVSGQLTPLTILSRINRVGTDLVVFERMITFRRGQMTALGGENIVSVIPLTGTASTGSRTTNITTGDSSSAHVRGDVDLLVAPGLALYDTATSAFYSLSSMAKIYDPDEDIAATDVQFYYFEYSAAGVQQVVNFHNSSKIYHDGSYTYFGDVAEDHQPSSARNSISKLRVGVRVILSSGGSPTYQSFPQGSSTPVVTGAPYFYIVDVNSAGDILRHSHSNAESDGGDIDFLGGGQ